MDNVIIKFEEQGLENILDGLVKLGTVDAKEAEQFKASNAAFKEKQALVNSAVTTQTKLSTETTKATKSMDDLAKAAASAAKNIVSGATNEAIKGTTTLTDQATASTKKYADSLLGLKQQVKDLQAEAIKAGEFTPLGQDFLKQAGEIKLQITEIVDATKHFGSKTEVFSGITEGLRGVGAGFEVAQGAQALFGTGNKNLEEQLVKIQGTMALVNGLTEIQRALQKDSAVVLGVQNLLKKVGITLTTESNVAEGTGVVTKTRSITVQAIENGLTSTSVVVRGAATAAQWLLNNAMLAFPLIAIIAGLVAVAGLMGAFSDGTEEATKSQIALTEAELENLKSMESLDAFVNQLSKDRQTLLQQELDLLKVQRASTDDIRAKELELAKERERNAQYQAGFHAQEIYDIEKNKLAIQGQIDKVNALKAAQAANGGKGNEDEITLAENQLELTKGLLKEGVDAKAEADAAKLNLEIKTTEAINQVVNEKLEFERITIDAKLRFAQEGSQKELSLQIAKAKNEYDIAIANKKNKNDSEADIEAAYIEKVQQLNIAHNNKILQDDIALNNAKLVGIQKGSEAELDLKLKNLENQNTIDLSNTKLSNDAKKALTAKYLNEVNVMLHDFNQKKTENELNAEILKNDALLQAEEKGSDDIYQLKAKQLSLQEALEIASIDKNIHGTELGEAKKLQIYSSYLAKKDALELEEETKIIERRSKQESESLSHQQRMADLEMSNVNTELGRRQQLELQAFDNKQKLADVDYKKDIDLLTARGASQKEFDDLKTEYDDAYRENKAAKDNEMAKQEKEMIQATADFIISTYSSVLGIAQQASNQATQTQLSNYDKETAANEQLHNQKKETDADYAKNKAIIDKKIKETKREEAKRNKAFSIAQIIINTAESVMKGYAQAGPFGGTVGAAIALAIGAAELGIAASAPIPEYYKGTENAPPGWAWVGEKGPELMKMKGGEKVKTHADSIKMANESVPSLRNSFYATVDRSPIPSELAKTAMEKFSKQTFHIDYGLLSQMIGKEVGNHLQAMPITYFSFDKNGFRASVKEGNSVTNYLDSRYSSN